LSRARAFAEPLLIDALLDTGEPVLAHADGVSAVLQTIGASDDLRAAGYLVYACEYLSKPEEVIAKAFGPSFAELALEATRLIKVQRQARLVVSDNTSVQVQTENVRKMLLAFSRDLRVVLLRLASRLQTLRFYAASKKAVPQALADESLHVFAPLANRLGIWQIKWEMEDLSFRFLEPDTYKHIA
jgi:GTP pyrophosphokinase